jgi:hypothetical protein
VGEQPLLERGGVERGEEHDERAAAGAPQHLADEAPAVGLDQGRLEDRQRVDGAAQDVGAPGALDRGPRDAVERQQVDAVPGPRGERGEQQRRVERGVQARHVAHAAGRRAARVDDEQQGAVALGRQVRTTTSWRRAVARQSIDRTSSPST